MDDYNISSLTESKNEWCSRLVNIFTPCIMEGLKSIFNEAFELCRDNNEETKYLMTFQNFLSRIPKWNPSIIEVEKNRIISNSACGYIEDLITCVHIIQLKALTCARVGLKQKKVDINIPSVDDFIHKIYINVARKLYTNVYLFEKDIMPLQIQKNNRELEIIIKECILNSVRDNIPIEEILRAYLDETEEQDVTVEEKNEVIKLDDDDVTESEKEKNTTKTDDEIIEDIVNRDMKNDNNESNDSNELNDNNSEITEETKNLIKKQETINENLLNNDETIANAAAAVSTSDLIKTPISFSDTDLAFSKDGNKEQINAPKTIERLNEIAEINNIKRKEQEYSDDEEENEKLNIGDNLSLDLSEVNDLTKKASVEPEILLSDIEILN